MNFRLSQDGEAIVLSRPDGTVAEALVFGVQAENVSQGRSPDGAASIQFQTSPTPRGANHFVAPDPPPVLSDIRATDGEGVQLTVATVVGRAYRLEFNDELQDQGWTAPGEARTASGGSLIFHDLLAHRPSRFCRVVLLPQTCFPIQIQCQ